MAYWLSCSHTIHDETGFFFDMNIQKSTTNKSIVSSKRIAKLVNKFPYDNENFENNGERLTFSSEGSECEKISNLVSAQESLTPLTSKIYSDIQPPIFRRMVDCNDRNEMMVLKRANHVCGSDDNEDSDYISFKRQKTSECSIALNWEDRLHETSNLSSLYLLRR